ncbi:MAG: hypothetical protein U0457_09820 [Candidatus Sericytochromatia bacterium]
MSVDKIKEFSVMIDEGSGCLVRPDSDDYDYIFTCRHVIEISKEDKNLKNKDSIEIKLYSNEKIDKDDIIDIYSEEEYDTAIIKIKKRSSIKNILIAHNQYDENNLYRLIGFPKCRKNDIKEFRSHKLNYSDGDEKDIYFECELTKIATYDEINGLSGGGIILHHNEKSYILGIQAKVPENESIARVFFIPIKKYLELIKKNNLCSIKTVDNIISNVSLDVCDFDLVKSVESFEEEFYDKKFTCRFFYICIKDNNIKDNFFKRIESILVSSNFKKTKEISVDINTDNESFLEDLNLILEENDSDNNLVVPIIIKHIDFDKSILNIEKKNDNKNIIFIIISSNNSEDLNFDFNFITIDPPIFKEFHLNKWIQDIFKFKSWNFDDSRNNTLKTLSKLQYDNNKVILNIKVLYTFLNKTINTLKKSVKDFDDFISILEGKKDNVKI